MQIRPVISQIDVDTLRPVISQVALDTLRPVISQITLDTLRPVISQIALDIVSLQKRDRPNPINSVQINQNCVSLRCFVI